MTQSKFTSVTLTSFVWQRDFCLKSDYTCALDCRLSQALMSRSICTRAVADGSKRWEDCVRREVSSSFVVEWFQFQDKLANSASVRSVLSETISRNVAHTSLCVHLAMHDRKILRRHDAWPVRDLLYLSLHSIDSMQTWFAVWAYAFLACRVPRPGSCWQEQ